MKQVMVHQLLAVRALVDSMIAQLTEGENLQDYCEHQNRVNLQVMGGGEKWTCRDCGFEFDEDKFKNEIKTRLRSDE